MSEITEDYDEADLWREMEDYETKGLLSAIAASPSVAPPNVVSKDWVTIGGGPCDPKQGEHCGGTPVNLDASGRIVQGPAHLRGKPVNALPGGRKPNKLRSRLNPKPEKPKPTKPKPTRGEPTSDKPEEPAKPTGDKPEAGRQGTKPTGEGARRPSEEDRSRVAQETGEKPSAPVDDRRGESKPAPSSKKPAKRVPARIETVNKRLDKYEEVFRQAGNDKLADWMSQLRSHVNDVGVNDALESLGPERTGTGEDVQYTGYNLDGNAEADFIEQYLNRAGISLSEGTVPTGAEPAVSAVAPSSDEEGVHSRPGPEGARDYFPKLQTLRDKLDEAQHLPGLEKSEDLGKLMGQEFGAKVPAFTDDVVKKLNETYGEGQWIVKSYGDEAYAGYGIFFPQRVAQLKKEAQDNIWRSGAELRKYGFEHLRDKDGNIVGIQHESGTKYEFGTEKYNTTIHGDARHWADIAEEYGEDEKQAAIPEGRFMAQPAFPVVGITNEERAQGVTFKKGQEGRVHIVTRNGKAELVSHGTWLKMEPLPVVFENDDTRAMAKAALEAINALPESERGGQIYAPDVVKTADGYRVVEANPANEAGASGYLQDNPLIMDSYAAQITGREPMHVKFIRRLLTERKKPTKKSLKSRLR